MLKILAKIKNQAAKLPIKSYLLYICVALFLTTGVTFSKYVTSSGGDDAARVVRFGKLTLTEETGQRYIYAPGVALSKDPKVTFSENELSAYVFVKIEADGWEYSSRAFNVDGLISWSVADGWTHIETKGSTVVFGRLVKAGEPLSEVPIISGNSIAVSEDAKNSDLETIKDKIGKLTFTAYAVQANGFENASSAWNAHSGK